MTTEITPHSYLIEEAIIRSPNAMTSIGEYFEIDIKSVISDFEIFEHLDKAYVTGNLIFLDTSNIFNVINFTGAETLSIVIRLIDEDAAPIEKTFVIDKVIKASKVNDQSEVITLHLTENHAFLSSIINLNTAYRGKPHEIIGTILQNELGKFLSLPTSEAFQSEMQVIIPNWSPLTACNWIKDRATTTDGMPYYLFGAFSGPFVHFLSLDQMINNTPINQGFPFTYSQVYTNATDGMSVDEQSFNIQAFRSAETQDLSKLIKKGLVGSSYQFHNIADGKTSKYTFRADELMYELAENGITSKEQNNHLFHPETFVLLNDERRSLYDIQSRSITQINSSSTYENYGIPVNSYSDDENIIKHGLKVKSKALRHYLLKDPIDIVVPGRFFLNGEYNNCVGNTVEILFLNNTIDQNNDDLESNTDLKRSGKYLIYASRHIFKKERYDVTLSCVKLANRSGD